MMRFQFIHHGRISYGVFYKSNHDHLIILSHGLHSDKSDSLLVRLAESLKENYDIILFDYSGHGESQEELSLDKMIEDLKSIMHYREYKHISLIGHSLGGYISSLIYQSDNVEKMVLLAPSFHLLDTIEKGVVEVPDSLIKEFKEYPIILHENVTIIHSSTDEVIPIEETYLMKEKNPSITVKVIEGDNHDFQHHRDVLVNHLSQIF